MLFRKIKEAKYSSLPLFLRMCRSFVGVLFSLFFYTISVVGSSAVLVLSWVTNNISDAIIKFIIGKAVVIYLYW